MIKPVLYSQIEEKNAFENELVAAFTPTDRLIHCLDLMDMIAKIRYAEIEDNKENKSIKWIVLNSSGT